MNEEFLDILIADAFESDEKSSECPAVTQLCLVAARRVGLRTFRGLLEFYANGRTLEDQPNSAGADCSVLSCMYRCIERHGGVGKDAFEAIGVSRGIDVTGILKNSYSKCLAIIDAASNSQEI